MIRRHHNLTLYLITFVALFILCCLFPYVHDDWAWGSQIGIDRLNNGFADYGGRYIGYLIVIVMTRSKILAALIMSGTLVSIGVCIKRIVGSRWAFLVSLTLIFLVSREIFAQSVSWISGFANYAITTLVVLIFIIILIDVFSGKKEKWYLVIFAIIFGFSGSLILENVTIYLVVLSIIGQIYLLIKEKRFSPVLFMLVVGAGAGAVWMFSNSAYHSVAMGEDEYRSTAMSISAMLNQAKNNYLGTIYSYGFFKNVVLNILLLISSIIAIQFKQFKEQKIQFFLLILLIFSIIYSIVANVVIGDTIRPEAALWLEGLFSLIAILSLFVILTSANRKKADNRKKYIILWLSFFIIIAPLFIITPIGPRNFLTPYVILTTLSLLWWKEIFNTLRKRYKKVNRKIKSSSYLVLYVLATSVWVIFVGIFATVAIADTLRIQDVKKQVDEGESTIIITTLPYESLMWQSTPRNEIFKERYKLFYNFPLNIKIINE